MDVKQSAHNTWTFSAQVTFSTAQITTTTLGQYGFDTTPFCEQKEQHLRFYAILAVSYLHRFTVQTHEGKPVSEEERRVITLVQLMPVIHEQGSRAVAYCMAPLTKATSSGEDAMYPVCSACWECPPSSPSIWSPSISSGPASFTCTVWHRHRARRKSSSFS